MHISTSERQLPGMTDKSSVLTCPLDNELEEIHRHLSCHRHGDCQDTDVDGISIDNSNEDQQNIDERGYSSVPLPLSKLTASVEG